MFKRGSPNLQALFHQYCTVVLYYDGGTVIAPDVRLSAGCLLVAGLGLINTFHPFALDCQRAAEAVLIFYFSLWHAVSLSWLFTTGMPRAKIVRSGLPSHIL